MAGDAEEQDDERGVAKKRKEKKNERGSRRFNTEAGRIRIQVIPDAKGVTLLKFINENVVEGSCIRNSTAIEATRSQRPGTPGRITVAPTSPLTIRCPRSAG